MTNVEPYNAKQDIDPRAPNYDPNASFNWAAAEAYRRKYANKEAA